MLLYDKCQLGQGLGGPLGGLMTDWFYYQCFIHDLLTNPSYRLGWRGAFLVQMPMLILSFGYVSYFLCYVTPVCLFNIELDRRWISLS